jgi:hypothetical protein
MQNQAKDKDEQNMLSNLLNLAKGMGIENKKLK